MNRAIPTPGPTAAMPKAEALALTERHLQPHRTRLWRQLGIEVVLGRRNGYEVEDLNGHRLLDLHLNGGTFNLGHRHPELVGVLTEALGEVDVGNHHFASPWRARLAQKLAAVAPGEMPYAALCSGGAEAVDLAIKAARYTTRRRKVVALERGYHGRTGLSGAAGDDSAARYFLSDDPAQFLKVPFNDLPALHQALSAGDVACVLMETIPATWGFPLPAPGYLPEVAALCRRAGALYVADEVQTGLGRTGRLWGVETFGVTPDLLVTSKGLGGGLYPFAAVLMTAAAGRWLEQDGWAQVSTFGGAELGCVVAERVLDITLRADTQRNAAAVAQWLGDGLRAIATRQPYLTAVRQCGLVMGLTLAHPQGALHLMQALHAAGVWAIFAGYDLATLQFKPGLLLSEAECQRILIAVETALGVAATRRNEAPLPGFGA